jgi:hypothetical protein
MLYLLRHGNFEASGSQSAAQCQKYRCGSGDCSWTDHEESHACKNMGFLRIDSGLDHAVSMRFGYSLLCDQ